MLRDENWKRLKIVLKNCHHQMNSTCRCFIADNNHKNTGIIYWESIRVIITLREVILLFVLFDI